MGTDFAINVESIGEQGTKQFYEDAGIVTWFFLSVIGLIFLIMIFTESYHARKSYLLRLEKVRIIGLNTVCYDRKHKYHKKQLYLNNLYDARRDISVQTGKFSGANIADQKRKMIDFVNSFFPGTYSRDSAH